MSVYVSATPYTIEYPIGSVAITIPGSKKISRPLLAWTLMWLVVFPLLGYLLVTNIKTLTGMNLAVVVIMLVVILFRIAPALYLLAWQIAGQETLEITPQAITLRSQIAGIGRTREYSAESIGGLYAAPTGSREFSFLRFGLGSFEVRSTGPIVLIYKGKKITFGLSLDYEGGRSLVTAVHQRLSQYNTPARLK
jgi:hypothetical protein